MNNARVWGVVLIVAALVALGLQLRRLRAGHITPLQFGAGIVARLGFVFLGVVYAFDLVYNFRRAPFIGLAMVGAGIALNLVAGIIENIRRARAPAVLDEDE